MIQGNWRQTVKGTNQEKHDSRQLVLLPLGTVDTCLRYVPPKEDCRRLRAAPGSHEFPSCSDLA